MKIICFFTFTLVSFFSFAQKDISIIKTINDRDFKIYKGNSGTDLFFEFCNRKILDKCVSQTISFDLRGIVSLLSDKTEFGEVKINGNGTIIREENGTTLLKSINGIVSDSVDGNKLKEVVRRVFFQLDID
tara:strand:+ start:452 stop:844 length:393 start_codon:yes stop_codon:yes gene_type:complete